MAGDFWGDWEFRRSALASQVTEKGDLATRSGGRPFLQSSGSGGG